MGRRRLLVAILAVGGMVTSMAVQVVPAEPFDSFAWPYVSPRSRVVRSITTEGNLWYAITMRIPPEKRYTFALQGAVADNESMTMCGAFHAEPEFNQSWGLRYRFPARSGANPRGYATFEQDDAGVLEYDTAPGETPVDGRPMYCAASLPNMGEDPVRVSFVVVMASDVSITSSRLLMTVDPGIKVLAESWGTNGTRIFNERSFGGGRRAEAGAQAVNLKYVAAGTVGQAAVAADRSLRIRYTRSSSAWLFPFHPDPASGVLIPGNNQALTSIQGPDQPPSSFAGSTFGQPDRWYALGQVSYTGLTPGTYTYRIEALAGATTWNLAGVFVPAGAPPEVLLATFDTDVPPCVRSKPVWRARDGHPVCGPGPALIKRSSRI